MDNGICSFYDHAKIRDLASRKEYYINWEEADLILKLVSVYSETQLKRNGEKNEG